MKNALTQCLLWACAGLAATAVAPVAVAVPVAAQDEASLEDLVARVRSERDEVDLEVVAQIADKGTREAMEALLDAYDTFASVYMRRAVAKRLSQFDEVEDAFQPALQKLVDIATQERARELRTAAVEALGRCREHGRTFLQLIVDSGAPDDLRERAFELHIRMGGEEDHPWYRKIYDRTPQKAMEEAGAGKDDDKKKKGNKRGRKKDEEAEPDADRKEIVWPTLALRALALEALLPTFEDQDLGKAFEAHLGTPIARTALEELSRRGSPKAVEYAEALLSRPDFRGSDRAMAAEVLVRAQGAKAAKDLIELAGKTTTQAVLRTTIADQLSGLNDEDVNKQLLKLVGKGKPHEEAFAIRATRHIRDDDKLAKKIRKGIGDREPEIAVASIEACAERKDREAIEDLEKVLDKTKDDDVRQAALRALSSIYDGENEWVERLEGFTGHEDADLRNAALIEMARLGRRNTVDVFKERLSHPDWATRLIALKALEDQRDPALLEDIVAQMKNESGRMAIEFGDALFRLTGESFGRNVAIWERWLKDNAGSIELIEPSKVAEILEEAEEKRLKQISEAEFFGIRIESHRVIFIIDVSGSMNEETRRRYVDEPGKPRIDVAKEELSKAIKALEDAALFNIVPFSGDVESWMEDGVASSKEATREDALEYVGRLGALGGTNLYGSLAHAFEDKDVDTIFILSDGEPSVGDIIDPQLIRDAVNEMNSTRNVKIHTVAIGLDLEILRWLAEDTGGTHVSIR